MGEAVVFASIVAGGLVWWLLANRERPARFRRRPIMTGSGLDFLFRLQRALPECRVCPQVAATALLEPLGVGRVRKAALARISGRRVGYAVFDKKMHLIVIIELDHRPRLTRREAECEAYLADAGIRTLRFRPKELPSESKIRTSVFPRNPSTSAASADGMLADLQQPIEFKGSAQWRNTLNAHS